jgi:hypothetical protein
MMTMSEQEQEHWDHVAGSASEFQNCYEEAGIRRVQIAAGEDEKIAAALAQGLFVVVNEQPHYCRVTDAVTGTVRYFDTAHLSIRRAIQRRDDLQAGDPDARVSIEPHLPEPPYVAPAGADDDVPF